MLVVQLCLFGTQNLSIAKIRQILTQNGVKKLVQHLLLPRWTTIVILYYQDVQIFLEEPPANPKCCRQSSDRR